MKGCGIKGDAHAGTWHRQISLLSFERIEEFRQRGAVVQDGDFGENMIVRRMDFCHLPVGTILESGSVVLEITQIGKECHSHCGIFERMGECIMPSQGAFAIVREGGFIREGDEITATLPSEDRPFRAAVITLSDKASRNERVDESGPAAAKMLTDAGYTVVEQLVLPDDPDQLKNELRRLADRRQVDLIVTSGGTGFSLRDHTPEATLAVADRLAPGIAEYIRMKSMEITDRAMLGRGVSVIRGSSIIINLPGSPKAVRESLGFVITPLEHGIRILRGSASECGRS